MALKAGTVERYKIHQDMGDYYDVRTIKNESFPLYKRYCYQKKFAKNQFVKLHSLLERNNEIVLSVKIPTLKNNDVGTLKIIDRNDVGYFLDNGIERHVLLPYSKITAAHLDKDDFVLVKIRERKEELYEATMTIPKYYTLKDEKLKVGDKIKGRVFAYVKDKKNQKKNIGIQIYLASGLIVHIHKEEMYEFPKLNDEIEFTVHFIREDGKVNGTLREHIVERKANDIDVILKVLISHNGVSSVTDRHEPDEIQRFFGISKKKFKDALARLIALKQVEIRNNKLFLLTKEN